MALERMSPVDTAWLHMDQPDNPADIVTLMTLDEPVDYEALKRTVEERLLRFSRFKQRVTEHEAQPCWEDEPDFDIENHVLQHPVPEPLTAETLAAVVTELGNQRLRPDRPLWAVHLLKDPEGATAIVARLHHCIADGFALAHAMLSLTDSTDGTPMVGEASSQGEEHEPLRQVLIHELEELVQHPRRALDLAKQTAQLTRSLGHLLLLPFDRDTLLKKKLSGSRRMAWSSGISLETIKAIGRSRGCTVNDVLMSAMTGALRRFLSEAGEPVDEFSVRAIVPVNLRPVHWIEEMDDSMGNRFGLVFLDLPVHASTPESRMRVLKERMNAIKGTPEALVAFGILNAIGHTPATVEHIINDIFGRKASLVVTNVPGPRQAIELCGSRVRDLMFWVPHPSKLGMGLSILSYAGTVIVGVRTDESISEDPARLVELFEEEVSAMIAEPR